MSWNWSEVGKGGGRMPSIARVQVVRPVQPVHHRYSADQTAVSYSHHQPQAVTGYAPMVPRHPVHHHHHHGQPMTGYVPHTQVPRQPQMFRSQSTHVVPSYVTMQRQGKPLTNSEPPPWASGPGPVTYHIPTSFPMENSYHTKATRSQDSSSYHTRYDTSQESSHQHYSQSHTLPSKPRTSKNTKHPTAVADFSDDHIYNWNTKVVLNDASSMKSESVIPPSTIPNSVHLYTEEYDDDNAIFNSTDSRIEVQRCESPGEYSTFIEAVPEDAIYAQVIKGKKQKGKKDKKDKKDTGGSQGSRSSSTSTGSAQSRSSLSQGAYLPLTQFQSGGNHKGHLFYLSKDRNREVPSWFFEDCTRDEAEGLLTVGRKFGNVLMRPSSTHKDTGKYVISMRREVSGGTQLNHYSIAKTSSGFKIDVDNKHNPMKCLSDVMDFFVSVAGPGTNPMRCNDVGRIYGKEDTVSRSSYPESPRTPQAPVPPSSGFNTTPRPPGWTPPPPPPNALSSTNTTNRLATRGSVSDQIQQAVQEINVSRAPMQRVESTPPPPPPISSRPPIGGYQGEEYINIPGMQGESTQYYGKKYEENLIYSGKATIRPPPLNKCSVPSDWYQNWSFGPQHSYSEEPKTPSTPSPGVPRKGYLASEVVEDPFGAPTSPPPPPPLPLVLPPQTPEDTNNNWTPKLNSPFKNSQFDGNPTLNQTVPPKTVPTSTMLRNMGHVESMSDGMANMNMGQQDSQVPPPPPISSIPPAPPFSGAIPPAPPFGAGVPPPPPAFSPPPPPGPPPSGPPPMSTPQSYSSSPPTGFQSGTSQRRSSTGGIGGGGGGFGMSAALSFEEELAKRLRPVKEQIYADATILKNY